MIIFVWHKLDAITFQCNTSTMPVQISAIWVQILHLTWLNSSQIQLNMHFQSILLWTFWIFIASICTTTKLKIIGVNDGSLGFCFSFYVSTYICWLIYISLQNTENSCYKLFLVTISAVWSNVMIILQLYCHATKGMV